MSSGRITRGGRPLPGSFNAEFTPGQMVMGICVFLFIAVLCFGAGVLVGRLEPKPAVDPLAQSVVAPSATADSTTTSGQPTTEAAPAAPTAPPATAPTPTPPPPRSAIPAPEPPPPGTVVAKKTAATPRTVDLPPLGASAKSSNRPLEQPVEVPVEVGTPVVPTPSPAAPEEPAPLPTTKSGANTKSGAVPPATPAAEAAKSTTIPAEALPPLPTTKSGANTKSGAVPPAPAPELTPSVPMDPEADLLGNELLETMTPSSKKAAATTKTAAATPAGKTAKSATTPEAPAPAAAGGGGNFGLQVGAFPGPNREAQAAELKKRADAAGLRAEIRPSKDKQYYRVVITGYRDRASALKALDDIKQRPGFEKAFVQDLSKL